MLDLFGNHIFFWFYHKAAQMLFHTGYYTRSGYVPGPVCKYNWTKVWKVADDRNILTPQVNGIKIKLNGKKKKTTLSRSDNIATNAEARGLKFWTYQ